MLHSRIKLILSILILTLSLPAGMIISEVLRDSLKIATDSQYVMIFSYIVMFSFMTMIVLVIKRIVPDFSVGFNLSCNHNPLYILWGILLLISWNIMISPASDYLPSAGNAQLDQIVDTGILSVLTAVVIAPFFEEWFFRGVLLTNFKQISGSSFWAVALSSAIFGISHVYPLQVLTAFGAGVVLSMIYLRTSSLFFNGLIHMSYNGIIYSLYTLNPEEEEIVSSSVPLWSVSALVIVVSMIFYMKKCPPGKINS